MIIEMPKEDVRIGFWVGPTNSRAIIGAFVSEKEKTIEIWIWGYYKVSNLVYLRGGLVPRKIIAGPKGKLP